MSVARHTAYNLAGAIAPAVVTIVTTPFYLAAIGVERYGLIAIFWTLSGLLSFLSLGMGPALTQRLAAGSALSPRQQSDLVWTALIPSLVMSLLGAMLILLGAEFYFDRFAEVPTVLQQEVRAAIPFVAASLPIMFATGTLTGALQAKEEFLEINAIRIATGVGLPLACLAVAWWNGPTLWPLVAAAVAVQAIGMVAAFAICRTIVPLSLAVRVDRGALAGLARFGGWMAVIQLLAPIVMVIDRLIIGALRGPAAVTAYVLPYTLVQRLILLPASYTGAMFPRLAASGSAEERRLQGQSIEAMAALLTPLAIGGTAILGPFLIAWVGAQLAAVASGPGLILIMGFWLHGLGHVPSTILMGRGQPRAIAILLLAGMLPYLSAVYLLTLYYGIVGAAFAWLARVLFDPLLLAWTRPPREPAIRAVIAGLLVATAVTSAAFLKWTSASYWVALGLLTIASLALHRAFWGHHGKRLVTTLFRAQPAAELGNG